MRYFSINIIIFQKMFIFQFIISTLHYLYMYILKRQQRSCKYLTFFMHVHHNEDVMKYIGCCKYLTFFMHVHPSDVFLNSSQGCKYLTFFMHVHLFFMVKPLEIVVNTLHSSCMYIYTP